MPETKLRQYVENNGGELLKYERAHHAVIKMRDGTRVAITVKEGAITLRPTRGFFDLFLDTKTIGSWNLTHIHAKQPDGTPFPSRTRDAVTLDIMVERISQSHSLRDVKLKASTGALDPLEDAESRLDSLAKRK